MSTFLIQQLRKITQNYTKTPSKGAPLTFIDGATQSNNRTKPNLTVQQQQIIEKIERDYLIAEKFFKRHFARPEVNFKLRGKSAGTAHLQINQLRFNSVLLHENFDHFITDVVPHEICHLLCFQLFGKVKPHGKEWQSLMIKVFKRSPNVTPQLDISSVIGKQFEYFCYCGSIKLSIRRHNKIQKGITQYCCKKCQKKLQLVAN